MPARSELAAAIRHGLPGEAGDRPRTHLGDGSCVWTSWSGEHAVDAEYADPPPPPRLAEAYGPDRFWERWTRVECAVKLTGSTIGAWLREHGLDVPPEHALHIETAAIDLSGRPGVVSAGRRAAARP